MLQKPPNFGTGNKDKAFSFTATREAASSPVKNSKIIFITGVSSGIGRSLAIAAVESGFRVYGTVRRESDGRSLAAELGEKFRSIILDVTDEDATRRITAGLLREIGPGGLHSLVNNAGISVPGALSEVDGASLRNQFEVNVFGPVRLTRAFLPLLEKPAGLPPRRHSLVVNISSMVTALNPPLSGTYTASKAALEAFSHAWRRELAGRGIDVMIVRPGAVRSNIWGKGETGPPVTDPHYNDAHRCKMELSARGLKNAYDCDEFGRRVIRLMGRRRPPVLVTLSREPWYVRRLPSILPRRWADRLIRALMGLD